MTSNVKLALFALILVAMWCAGVFLPWDDITGMSDYLETIETGTQEGAGR